MIWFWSFTFLQMTIMVRAPPARRVPPAGPFRAVPCRAVRSAPHPPSPAPARQFNMTIAIIFEVYAEHSDALYNVKVRQSPLIRPNLGRPTPLRDPTSPHQAVARRKLEPCSLRSLCALAPLCARYDAKPFSEQFAYLSRNSVLLRKLWGCSHKGREFGP